MQENEKEEKETKGDKKGEKRGEKTPTKVYHADVEGSEGDEEMVEIKYPILLLPCFSFSLLWYGGDEER